MTESPAVGAVLGGRYEVERELGRGGSSIVHLARDRESGGQVALKLLAPELVGSSGWARFEREIEVTTHLDHPNVLRILGVGRHDGYVYYTMPFVEGATLKDRIRREGALPVIDAVAIAREVAAALGYAHRRGVVHRDVKPGNILLGEHGAIVADFGVARAISDSEDDRITSTGVAIGTPCYMSPEQIGGVRVDGRSDVYALGCVLFEMLTGEPPFDGRSARAILAKHLGAQPGSPRALRSTISESLESVVLRAIEKVPSDRFATCEDFEAALASDAVLSTVQSGPAQRMDVRVVGAVVAAALVFAALILRPHPPLDPSRIVVASVPATSMPDDSARLDELLRYHVETAIRRVPGRTVLDNARVQDMVARVAVEGIDLAALGGASSRLDAGLLVVPTLQRLGDSVSVNVNAYPVRRDGSVGDPARRARRSLSTRPDRWRDGVARTIEDLFDLPLHSMELSGSEDVEAARAYVAARQNLEQGWDFEEARRLAATAVSIDPTFTAAHLLLAEVMSWGGEPEEEWLVHAARASSSRGQLRDDHEGILAVALHALAQGRYDVACAEYDQAAREYPDSYRAWIGRAECRVRDGVVVEDPASASGYRFRSDYEIAYGAYRTALALVPSLHFAFRGQAFTRLSDLLWTEPRRLRFGRTARGEELYAAYAGVDANGALVFVPYPASDVLGGTIEQPEGRGPDAAAAVSLQRLLDVVDAWVRAFPSAAEALEARALALEATGRIGGVAGALADVVLARAGAVDERTAIRLTVQEARLHLKSGDIAGAVAIADSLLDAVMDPAPEEARLLSGVAAFLGRRALSRDLLVTAAPLFGNPIVGVLPQEVFLPVIEARERLRADVAFGIAPERDRAGFAEVERLVERSQRGEPDRLVALRHQLLDDLYAWGYPSVGVGRGHRADAPNRLLVFQHRLAIGDTAAVELMLRRLRQTRSTDRPGDLTPDRRFNELWLYLQLGDSLTAAQDVRDVVQSLETLPASVLAEPQQAASLVKTFVLAARLLRRIDPVVAQRAAEYARIAWSTADPDVADWIEGELIR